mgnify:CR=1 FL=1
MNPPLVIKKDVVRNDLIGFLITHKLMSGQTIFLQYGVKCFDMRILIRRLRQNTLMLNLKLQACLFKHMADELQTVISTDHRP